MSRVCVRCGRQGHRSHACPWPASYKEAKKARADMPKIKAPPNLGFSDGDVITIAGYKRMPDGSVVTDCERGEESLWRIDMNWESR